jgi:asparagine synthase (glutamine-hydrolysing)
MKTADAIEKGILRRAFAHVLPEDVLNRKKSAYPSAQNPAYEKLTRDWALQILNDSNAAIQPLLDTRVARTLVENNAAGLPGITLVSLSERIIQMNEWLKKYQVTLVI